MDTRTLEAERDQIADLFKEQRVYVAPRQIKRTPVNAMFTLAMKPGERIKRVRDLLPEISLIVSQSRGESVDVRLNERPLFLDIPHTIPEPLDWRPDRPFYADRCLAGRGWSFKGGADQWVDLMKEPHVLVAGITGSGKSVLTLNLVLSLALGTSPEDLVMVLVDLKNEDLVPLNALPHVARFAGDPQSAVDAVEWVYEEVERRRDTPGSWTGFRVVLVIDELAQLPGQAKETLTRITALGRSMKVNVIAATQHPTAEVLGGSTGKINYTARFTGMVADASAASTASGRPKTGAEFLPGNGSFIRTGGSQVTRLQSFLIEDHQVEGIVAQASRKWGSVQAASDQVARTMPTEAVRIPAKAGVAMADVEGVVGGLPGGEELDAYFEEHYDGQGGLADGTLAGAIRIIYGDQARTSGRKYQEQRAVVFQELQKWVAGEDQYWTDVEAEEDGERVWEYAPA